MDNSLVFPRVPEKDSFTGIMDPKSFDGYYKEAFEQILAEPDTILKIFGGEQNERVRFYVFKNPGEDNLIQLDLTAPFPKYSSLQVYAVREERIAVRNPERPRRKPFPFGADDLLRSDAIFLCRNGINVHRMSVKTQTTSPLLSSNDREVKDYELRETYSPFSVFFSEAEMESGTSGFLIRIMALGEEVRKEYKLIIKPAKITLKTPHRTEEFAR